ncbi:MAG: Gfo/Idh/MocA family oxidoreductase [Coprococcus sp.]
MGTSWITDHFLDAALKCPEFKLEAVYSRNLEKAKKFGGKYGVGKYRDSLGKAEDPEIDAVYIASPNSLCTVRTRNSDDGSWKTGTL